MSSLSNRGLRNAYADKLDQKYQELCHLLKKTNGLDCLEDDLYISARKALKRYERTQKGFLPSVLPCTEADRPFKKPYCWHDKHADFGVQVEGKIDRQTRQYVTTTAQERYFYENDHFGRIINRPRSSSRQTKINTNKKRRTKSAVDSKNRRKLSNNTLSSDYSDSSSDEQEKSKERKSGENKTFDRWSPKKNPEMKEWLKKKAQIEKEKRKKRRKEIKEEKKIMEFENTVKKEKQIVNEMKYREWCQNKLLSKRTNKIYGKSISNKDIPVKSVSKEDVEKLSKKCKNISETVESIQECISEKSDDTKSNETDRCKSAKARRDKIDDKLIEKNQCLIDKLENDDNLQTAQELDVKETKESLIDSKDSGTVQDEPHLYKKKLLCIDDDESILSSSTASTISSKDFVDIQNPKVVLDEENSENEEKHEQNRDDKDINEEPKLTETKKSDTNLDEIQNEKEVS